MIDRRGDRILSSQDRGGHRREALKGAALNGIEAAGAAVGVPHMAALKALITPGPDSLVSLANEAQGFAASEGQAGFEQLSSRLTGISDITSPVERAGEKILDAATPSEKPPREEDGQVAESASRAEQTPEDKAAAKRRAELARLEAAKQEFERISAELERIARRVKSVTNRDVVRSDFDQSQADVKSARTHFERLAREDLRNAAELFHRTVMEIYAQYPQQQEEVSEKLQAQYRRLDAAYRQLMEAFDALEKKFYKARPG